MGRATHDVMGRQLAAKGKLEEVKPIFNQAHKAVVNGGVLTLKDPLDFLDGFKHIETLQTTVFSDVSLLGSVLPV